MMSLFSSFDAKLNFMLILPAATVILMLSTSFYYLNWNKTIMSKFNESFDSYVQTLMPLKTPKLVPVFMAGLVFFLITLNFSSVFCYIFPLTSQLSLVMMISLSMWFSFILFFMNKSYKMFLIHSTPEGAPYLLITLLFAIETLSNAIRPITVTVRLVANILAGHLLMILLSELVLNNFMFSPLYLLLNMVELFVSLIQAYIYVTMMTLYLTEIH